MENLTQILYDNKANPLHNNGWDFDFGFIKKMTERANQLDDSEELISMEETNSVLMTLFELVSDKTK